MAGNGFRKWIAIGALAVAPVALAQGTRTMDEAQQNSLDAALAATPVKTAEEQQIDALQKQVDALSAALNAQQQRQDERRELLGDPNSHPLWP